MLASVVPSTTQAQNGTSYGGVGYGYYPFFGYNRGQQQYIPYFALHPPVYYSQPVARPYGYSPFAYPPGTVTPEPAEPKSELTINPYVPRKSKPTKPLEKTAQTKVLRIRNPYFYGETDPSVARVSLRQ